jgi:glyoxylase-like metal-dependent hydrolase (beta-lactamase superfamily II)
MADEIIPYVREIEFEYGKVDQVSPLIRRVICNNPGPFTFKGTGTYIIGRGDGVAVIDPGPDDADHLQVDPGRRGRRTRQPHPDHPPPWTTRRWPKPLAQRRARLIYGCAVKGPVVEDSVRTEAGSDSFTPDVSVCGGATIAGPGWSFEAIPTPGHTSNHICYALAEENACFTGDHIMGWSTTVVTPPDGNMGDYLASLDVIKRRDFKTLWPTHGPPITEPGPFIDAYRAHRMARERQILAQLAAGETRIVAMVPKMYIGVGAHLYPAAGRSVLAHLIELVKDGRVVTNGAAGPDSEYRLA